MVDFRPLSCQSPRESVQQFFYFCFCLLPAEPFGAPTRASEIGPTAQNLYNGSTWHDGHNNPNLDDRDHKRLVQVDAMEISFDFGLVGNGAASMLSSWLTVAAVTAPHAASHTALMAAAATAPAATSPAIVPTLLALSGGLIAPAAAVAAVAGIAFAGVALSAQGPFRRRSLLFLQRWGRKLRRTAPIWNGSRNPLARRPLQAASSSHCFRSVPAQPRSRSVCWEHLCFRALYPWSWSWMALMARVCSLVVLSVRFRRIPLQAFWGRPYGSASVSVSVRDSGPLRSASMRVRVSVRVGPCGAAVVLRISPDQCEARAGGCYHWGGVSICGLRATCALSW